MYHSTRTEYHTIRPNNQTITSKKTSRSIVPGALKTSFNKGLILKGDTILDWGGGAYNKARDYAKLKHNVNLNVYDPWNRDHEHNTKALDSNPTVITCFNVLNVLTDDTLKELLHTIKSYSMYTPARVIFGVYTGNRSGIHKVTRDGFQRNEPLDSYLRLVKKYFPHCYKMSGLIIADMKC